MKDKVLISVIVTVYKGEKYIKKAIESILDQTLKEIEIIIVDNKSDDSTVEIVKILKEKDSRIKLIELSENKGPGNARNIGIELSKGEYIAFCDADDWIEKEMLFSMYQENEKYDVIVCGYSQDTEKEEQVIHSKKNENLKLEKQGNKEVVKSISALDYQKTFSFCWNKLYRREIIMKNNIKFSNKLFGEDYDFNLNFFKYAESLKSLNKSYYHYIKRNNNSLTERKIPNFFENINERFNDMVNLLKEKNIYNEEQKRIISILFIKHMMACVIRTYSDESFSFSKRYKYIKQIFLNPLSLELYKYASGNNIKEKIYCSIYKTQNILLMMLFNGIIYFLQKNLNIIFQIIK